MIFAKKNIYFGSLIIILHTLLNYSYLNIVSPKFSYGGMYSNPDLTKIFLSYFILFFIIIISGLIRSGNAKIGLMILTIYVYIPNLSFWALTNNSNQFIFILCTSIVVITIVSNFNFKFKIKKIKTISNTRNYVYGLYAIILSIVLTELIRGGVLSGFSLGISDVYERRGVVHGGALSSLGGYLMIWFAKILNPIFFTLYLLNKKYMTALVFLVLQFLLFGLTGHKGQLFYPFLAYLIALSVLHNNGRVYITGFIVIVVSLAIIISSVEFDNILASAFLSRTFYAVSLNHFDYYHFFQDNSYTYWSNSILRSFIDYPYSSPVPLIIGEGRWNVNTDAFANAGYLASGYMHFGAMGVLIYSFLIGVILRLFDMLKDGTNKPIVAAATALSMQQLANVDLLSAILTHGIIVALIVVYLLKKRI